MVAAALGRFCDSHHHERATPVTALVDSKTHESCKALRKRIAQVVTSSQTQHCRRRVYPLQVIHHGVL